MRRMVTKKTEIIGLCSRIISYQGTEGSDFAKSSAKSKNASRTYAGTTRKGYDCYQLRRKSLISILVKNIMVPDDEIKAMPKMKLWEIRSELFRNLL